MKRSVLVRHLERQGCRLLREGGRHSVFIPAKGKVSTVPRHRELNEFICRKICEDLEVVRAAG